MAKNKGKKKNPKPAKNKVATPTLKVNKLVHLAEKLVRLEASLAFSNNGFKTIAETESQLEDIVMDCLYTVEANSTLDSAISSLLNVHHNPKASNRLSNLVFEFSSYGRFVDFTDYDPDDEDNKDETCTSLLLLPFVSEDPVFELEAEETLDLNDILDDYFDANFNLNVIQVSGNPMSPEGLANLAIWSQYYVNDPKNWQALRSASSNSFYPIAMNFGQTSQNLQVFPFWIEGSYSDLHKFHSSLIGRDEHVPFPDEFEDEAEYAEKLKFKDLLEELSEEFQFRRLSFDKPDRIRGIPFWADLMKVINFNKAVLTKALATMENTDPSQLEIVVRRNADWTTSILINNFENAEEIDLIIIPDKHFMFFDDIAKSVQDLSKSKGIGFKVLDASLSGR